MSAPATPFPPRPCIFNTFTPQQPRVTAAGTANTSFDIELADSTRVDARKHVNPSVYAVARCIPLALLTLTPREPKVTAQQPAGGDVSHLHPLL